MFTKSNSGGSKSHKDFNIGVIIIFLIVTAVFLLSLKQSIYGKKVLSQKTDMNNLQRIVSIK